jgi:hypothetical protein
MTQTDWLRGQTLVADDLDLAFGRCIDRAGDIMTGEFQLAGDPLKAMDAATKHYVDMRVAGGASLIISDTPPVATSPGLMWFDSVGAQCYMWYSDANSSQWVPLNAPPALAAAVAYLPLSGGTMTGPVIQAADPVAALGTATKQYVDAGTAAAEHNVGRNLLHNSLFNVAQRGVGPWTAAGYSADRWALDIYTSSLSTTIIAAVDADRTAIGDEAAQYVFSNVVNGTSGANDYAAVAQKIEGIRRTSGKTVTLSFWARSNSGTPLLGVGFYQSFGSGGSPSSTVTLPGQTVTLSTTWTRYSRTFTMPSAAAKTLGTNGNDRLSMYFWFSAGTGSAIDSGSVGVQSNTFFLWGVQLEIGSVATPLEKPDPQQDLAKCQRFYQIGGGTVGSYAPGVGTNIYYTQVFQVFMRSAPTVVITPSGGANYSAVAIGTTGQSSFVHAPAAISANPVTYNFNFTASADL